MLEILGSFLIATIALIWFGYCVGLLLSDPEKFEETLRRLGKMSLILYGNSRIMEKWVTSQLYLVSAQIAVVIFLLVSFVAFVHTLLHVVALLAGWLSSLLS
jgi:hypothetical protein